MYIKTYHKMNTKENVDNKKELFQCKCQKSSINNLFPDFESFNCKCEKDSSINIKIILFWIIIILLIIIIFYLIVKKNKKIM